MIADWILVVIGTVAVLVGLPALWRRSGSLGRLRQLVRFGLIIAAIVAMAALSVKGYYHGLQRPARIGQLVEDIGKRIDQGEAIGHDLLKYRSDALVPEAAERVERWREDTMHWLAKELPGSGMDRFFGTVPLDIPHEKIMESVRRRLDRLLDNLRQVIGELPEHI